MTLPRSDETVSRNRVALLWQVGLAAYMQLVSWVPLGRWNRQPCCPTGLQKLGDATLRGTEVVGIAAFLLLPLAFWLGVRRGWWGLKALALSGYAVWLGLQLWTWWPPYLLGASDHWREVYERAFSQSTPILPRWADHLPPDAMHFVLQALLVGVLFTGLRTFGRNERR